MAHKPPWDHPLDLTMQSVFTFGSWGITLLLFYLPGQWTVFTSFDTPQPPWTFSGYVILYAGPAMILCRAT